MPRLVIAAAIALGLLIQFAMADNPPAPPKPDPGQGGTPDPSKGQGFTAQPIAPLRDGNDYWPGYLLMNSGPAGGEIKVCYIIAHGASSGGVQLLCSDPAVQLGTPPKPKDSTPPPH